MIRCWCCPPNLIFFMAANPCSWPECVCGERPNPNVAGSDADNEQEPS